ncbi:MAG: beta-N-acetylhexosaminidase [Myxococcales bacterium]|nr:beta-N-acetylhexosaminidase [Myxococcales bacterium]
MRAPLLASLPLLFAACRAPDEVAPTPPAELALVPLPVSVTTRPGAFALGAATRIAVAPGAEGVGERLAEVLRPSTGLALPVVTAAGAATDVALRLDAAELAALGPEGYLLEVGEAGVAVTAPTPAGLFYGCQTLRQMLPAEVERRALVSGVAWTVPYASLRDTPRFAWRGAMLDVARHFFGVANVERFVDLASYHKLNRLHLHLTDDQGWRVQIDAWPALATVGGATEVGDGPGGYYTKADVAELVAYAEARFVTLVPEIDLPGHVNAALSAYGELNPDGQPAAPYTGTDVGWSSLWLDGPATAGFVADVLAEVAAAFPGPFLHIGGDEAEATPAAAYAAFVASLGPEVAALGKTLVGWEEVGAAELAPPFLAQFWLSDAKIAAARDRGAGVIASPAPYAYLDMKYDAATPIGQSYLGFTSVQKAYEWDPVLGGLGAEDVVGLEAPLWTETVASLADVELLAYPRLARHGEIAWSPREGRDWETYRVRLARHGARLDALEVGYHRSAEIDWP